MRPSRVTPWKPGDHGDLAGRRSRPPDCRAGCRRCGRWPWASSVDDRHLPAQPRAGVQAHVAQGHGQQAGRDLFARRHHGVVFVVRVRQALRGAARAVGPGHQLVGLAGHGRDHHRHLFARGHFGRDQARHATDALQVGHRRAAELHHQPRHVSATSKTGQFLRGTRLDAPARASRRLLATLMRRRNARNVRDRRNLDGHHLPGGAVDAPEGALVVGISQRRPGPRTGSTGSRRGPASTRLRWGRPGRRVRAGRGR